VRVSFLTSCSFCLAAVVAISVFPNAATASSSSVSVARPPISGFQVGSTSVGGDHTCGIKSDGTAWCWGKNENGQVDGKPISSSPYYAAGQPPGGGTFVQISAGNEHSCGIKTDGSTICWGLDANGEVGGKIARSPLYYASGPPPGGGTYLQVSAGASHSCGIRNDGSVLCWGSDQYGQVDGRPVTIPPLYASGSPPGGAPSRR
jgi:alpha-tubulin suppressor-like RCC1 family protein